MKLNDNATLYFSEGHTEEEAFKASHRGPLAIGAHQDDLEIFAMHGIGNAYEGNTPKFVGVTVTNGDGSPRKGEFANYTNEEMMAARLQEQNEAAEIGRYGAQIQLGYKSSDIKGAEPTKGDDLVADIVEILNRLQPETVYLHNPFDKHDTHLAITRAALKALRAIPEQNRPAQVYGCEVWRGLDWVLSAQKVALDVSPFLELQEKLIDCHKSQIAGSKNYTQATIGRQLANATYLGSHDLEEATAMTYAVDLMPLLKDASLSMADFARNYVQPFADKLVGKAKEYDV